MTAPHMDVGLWFEVAKGGLALYVCLLCGAAIAEESGTFKHPDDLDTNRERHLKWHRTVTVEVDD